MSTFFFFAVEEALEAILKEEEKSSVVMKTIGRIPHRQLESKAFDFCVS